VRITTIYEGTSEIMEMTIARDRWQQHLKTRGGFYNDLAADLERSATTHPEAGGAIAALAARSLAAVMETCRVHRLTRNQHVLFRLGELVAYTECAAALSRRAVRAAEGSLPEKTDRRFDAPALAVLARLAAREAAMKVALDGSRWALSSAEPPLDPSGFGRDVGIDAIFAAQAGATADADRLADVLYGRTST
jgi:alkylation response protein AidB-like acyl-CoA dehydrogenase